MTKPENSTFRRSRKWSRITFGSDPDYTYLLNGLNIVVLRAPYHVDHPGTPVQLIVAITIVVTWSLTIGQHGFSNIKDEVLLHPEFYLNCINWVFISFESASLFYFGNAIWKASGRIGPALVGALSVFMCNATFAIFHRIMPEPMQLAASLVLAGVLAPLAFSGSVLVVGRTRAIGVGALLAFSIAAKITAAPLVILVLLLPTWKDRGIALAAIVVGLVVATLPILSRYPEMAHFYFEALKNGGDGGPSTSFSQTLENVVSLCNAMPEIYLCPAIYCALLFARMLGWVSVGKGGARLLVLGVAVTALLTLLVAKRPELIHLIPVLGLLCLGNAISAYWLFENQSARSWEYAGLITVICFTSFLKQSQFIERALVQTRAQETAINSANSSGCFLVPYYNVNQVPFNLFFGNRTAGGNSSGRLDRIFPYFISYDVFSKRFRSFRKILSWQEVINRFSKEKCVYFEGGEKSDFVTLGVPKDALVLVRSIPRVVSIYSLKPDWIATAKLNIGK